MEMNVDHKQVLADVKSESAMDFTARFRIKKEEWTDFQRICKRECVNTSAVLRELTNAFCRVNKDP